MGASVLEAKRLMQGRKPEDAARPDQACEESVQEDDRNRTLARAG